jgi:diguanylate cyclase (GGDEF)-like protein
VEQILGKKLTDLPGLQFAAPFQKAIEHTLESGKENSFEATIPTASGSETHIITMVVERDESERVVGVLTIGQDISHRKRLEQELKRRANFDFLTGLVNRRRFIELSKNELSRIRRYGGTLSLIMFDIDFFKKINDTHGHSAGDLVLQKIARVCRDTVREIDIVGRIGGEEFVVLMPQTDRQQAAEAAERLRLDIAAGEVILEKGNHLRCTASFGVVTIDGSTIAQNDKTSLEELMIRADAAMYRAKKNGRNNVYLSSDS